MQIPVPVKDPAFTQEVGSFTDLELAYVVAYVHAQRDIALGACANARGAPEYQAARARINECVLRVAALYTEIMRRVALLSPNPTVLP